MCVTSEKWDRGGHIFFLLYSKEYIKASFFKFFYFLFIAENIYCF